MKLISRYIILLILLAGMVIPAVAEEEICAVYITGIGCPNCALTDPILLTEYTQKYPNLIIIEYELYKHRAQNQDVVNEYFENYIDTRPGVPVLILGKGKTALGRFEVLEADETLAQMTSNSCPMPDGTTTDFSDIDLTGLAGEVNIWTKDRVLSSGEEGDSQVLKELLTGDIEPVLEQASHEVIEPTPVPISEAEIEMGNAAKIGDWTLHWNGDVKVVDGITEVKDTGLSTIHWVLIGLALLLVFFGCYKFWTGKRCLCMTDRQKKFLIIGISTIVLIGFFLVAKSIPYDSLEQLGYSLPLPLFTLFIALIDGFNPCNLFVLTMLLGLLVTASHSRKKIYIIGYTFIFVVLVIYLLFMAAWLNIFKYIGFVTPLRVTIASIAIIAGLINCKELVAFRKGITLMVQEKHKGPLVKRIERMKKVIVEGSTTALILASIGLAAFASLVELPCTAGFPIIYTGILTGKVLASSMSYYIYLLLYNVIYVVPLLVIVTIFGYTFQGKQVGKTQMQIIKFIGGLIMIALGIILLVNPSLIGIGL